MPTGFRRLVPVVRVFDFPRAKRVYLDFLGFTIDGEEQADREGPRRMEISSGGMVLHLSSHHGEGTPGAKLYIEMAGRKQFHREVTSQGYRFWRPGIKKTACGARAMEVGDPFGNRPFFSERLKPVGKSARKKQKPANRSRA
jgi:hypothetical protein